MVMSQHHTRCIPYPSKYVLHMHFLLSTGLMISIMV
jgi:hypothetical protein